MKKKKKRMWMSWLFFLCLCFWFVLDFKRFIYNVYSFIIDSLEYETYKALKILCDFLSSFFFTPSIQRFIIRIQPIRKNTTTRERNNCCYHRVVFEHRITKQSENHSKYLWKKCGNGAMFEGEKYQLHNRNEVDKEKIHLKNICFSHWTLIPKRIFANGFFFRRSKKKKKKKIVVEEKNKKIINQFITYRKEKAKFCQFLQMRNVYFHFDFKVFAQQQPQKKKWTKQILMHFVIGTLGKRNEKSRQWFSGCSFES